MKHELERARAQTDGLFGLLNPSELYERPIQERHRIIFYVGHLEAFDWNLVCRRDLGLPSFSPELDRLFEAGIDPEPGKGPTDKVSDWPRLEQVHEYVAQVRDKFDRALSQSSPERLHIAIEHRLMHAETLAYMLNNREWEKQLPQPPPVTTGMTPENPLLPIPAGTATLGQAAGRFGWDNEFNEHAVAVPGFQMSKHKVTNGEYLKFVESGAAVPNFWTRRNGDWFYRGMFGLIPLPLDWPVYVTQEQASAYAAWKGKRLLTEAEFHRAAYGTPQGTEREYPWGDQAPSAQHGNFDFHAWNPTSVTATPAGDSAFGISQLLGNGWEWTSTPFGPFEGFQPRDYYPGYSANFFDNAHYVIKGGSPRTASAFLRRSFRNWFRPNYPYVYAGFRLVEN